MTQAQFVRRLLQLLWFVLGAWLLGWVIFRNFPPDGSLTARVRAAQSSGFIGGVTPTDRAEVFRRDGQAYTRVSGEPAYFRLAKLPFAPTAKVRLRFRNSSQPVFELGGRISLDAWAFDLRPLDVPLLDGLGWSARQDGSYRIYERKPTDRTAEEILQGSGTRVAVFHAAPERWGLRLGAVRGPEAETGPLPEGVRRLYVIPSGHKLEVALEFRRAPAAAGGSAEVRLARSGETLLTRRTTGEAVDLALSGAEDGPYLIEIAADGLDLASARTRGPKLVWTDPKTGLLRAPTKGAFFEAEFPTVTWETDLRAAPYDVIVAGYRPPKDDGGGWKIAEAEFDLAGLAADRGDIQMVLSLPALKKAGGDVEIDWIEVEYRREPLTPGTFAGLFKRWLDSVRLKP
jgi:hypothetical protein